jgi:meiotically up-regulated gene 157 (Mug157) protein
LRGSGSSGKSQATSRALTAPARRSGSLPEAYDAETSEAVSRHWFAWPNAAYACVELGVFKP